MKKVKKLAESDVQEIVKFQKYLEDMRTMPAANFYARYQDYMGLSDAEVKKILKGRGHGKG